MVPMILIWGRPAKTMAALEKAAKESPAMVEIETPAGLSPSYKGMLDRLPNGVTYIAKEKSLIASFTKVGKRIELNR